ncbi:MAG: branched-chain amino acid ABC transporter permease [Candidatus Rokubacteria bacterium]|nr:branched-chain amino acid ABC transporter permease [Candidatus Rokubacteria bacterium]
MALGLTMVYGVLRVLHIAHAAVFTLGGYGGLAVYQATGSFWLALRAASQDQEMAAACGMRVRGVVMANFAIGSALAGAAGMLVGIDYNSVSPTMGDVAGYKGLAIIVLGGLGSIPGTVLGALVIGLVETLVIGFVEFPLPRDAWAFLAMIAVFLARPQGLLGVK